MSKPKMNVRQRGARYEREIADLWKGHGYEAYRSQQFSGANHNADVEGVPHLHIECKRTEALRLYKALHQARSGAKAEEIPTVWHRRDREDSVVILGADDFIELYKKAYKK